MSGSRTPKLVLIDMARGAGKELRLHRPCSRMCGCVLFYRKRHFHRRLLGSLVFMTRPSEDQLPFPPSLTIVLPLCIACDRWPPTSSMSGSRTPKLVLIDMARGAGKELRLHRPCSRMCGCVLFYRKRHFHRRLLGSLVFMTRPSEDQLPFPPSLTIVLPLCIACDRWPPTSSS
nr:hypothetical protein CFP56_76481 [Quercus suber]